MTLVETPREALGGAIRDLVSAVEAAGSANDWTLLGNGAAALDWTENEQPSGWGDQPLQDAYRTGTLLWYLVHDDALAIADLLDAGRGIGLLAASRPLAEASARCELLLRHHTAPEVRVRRMVNERLHALHEDWRYAKDLPVVDSSWQMNTCKRLIDVGERDFGMAVGRPDGIGTHETMLSKP